MKKLASRLGFLIIPMGFWTFMACGPEMTEETTDLSLNELSDNYITVNGRLSEYSACRDTLDNDGDGLTDTHDPDCHINPGPLRDLSVAPAQLAANFNPDVSKIFPQGPGFPGGFRDRAQITEWNRFLTEPDGYTSATKLWGPGVNPEFVPVPQPSPVKINFGTFHQGNNNNVNVVDMESWYGAPSFISTKPVLPCSESPVTQGAIGLGYTSGDFGLVYKQGSQGYRNMADTGNLDGHEDKY